MLSIVERQRHALSLAAAEGVVLSHRHHQPIQMPQRENYQSRVPIQTNIQRDWTTNKIKKLPARPKKFSPEEAAQIRAAYDTGVVSMRDLAQEWNCGPRCINQVVRRWGAYKNL